VFEKVTLEHVRAVIVQVGVLFPREVANTHAGVDTPVNVASIAAAASESVGSGTG
jgi:hypothetical protein